MKFILKIILFTILTTILVFSQQSEFFLQLLRNNIDLRDIRINYKTPEILKYRISWEFIYAGDAEMGITEEDLHGHKVYRIYTRTSSNKTLDLIYKVRNETDSYVDYSGFYTLRFIKNQNEAGYVSKDDVYFDHKNNLWYNLVGNTTGYIPSFVLDVISSLYWIRTQNIEVGKKYIFSVWVGNVVYPMIVDVLNKQKIKILDKEYECFKVEPKVDIKSFPLFRAKGRLLVYITADEKKLPVRLESKVFIGKVFADLVEVN